MYIITCFSYICIVWISICVDLLCAEAEITVSGRVGSTVVLPCKMQSAVTEPRIRWLIGSETVFERAGKATYQDEEYKFRVDVPEEELHKGDCSLVLNNLKLTDAAVYNGYQVVSYSEKPASVDIISSVKLSVYDRSSGEKPAPRGDAGMTRPHLLILALSLTLSLPLLL